MRNIIIFVFLFSFGAQAKERVVKIGLASNFSEVSSSSSNPYGDYFRSGAKLALENNKQALSDKNIKIVFKEFDYGTSQLKVVKAASEACKSNVSLVMGYVYSSHALLATPIHQKCKLPLFSPSATASRLSKFKSYVHLGSFSNDYQGEVLARLAKNKLKAKTALIISAEDCAYCTDLSKSFEKSFKSSKGRSTQKISMLSSDKNFSEIAKKAKKIKADVILVPNHELFSARIISALVQEGINVPFLGGDGWGNHGEQFLKVLKGQKISGFSLSHWFANIPTEKSQSFMSQYKKRFGKVPNDTVVLSYDSMNIIIKALLKNKSFKRSDIETALNQVKSHQGVTGNIQYNGKGAPKKDIVLLKAGQNKYKFVKVLSQGAKL